MAKERDTLRVKSERAVLAAVRLPDSRFDRRDPFGELRSLAEQGGATVVGELTQSLDRPVSGTYMGSGKVQELKALCETLEATTVIFDHDLAPKQIANIEKGTNRKVVDRSELILDIFAGRASTHEAKLQVELAQLEYTFPRLRAMWSHLERIVGGIGTRGPGEQQLEIDRRLVANRKVELTRELREIQARKHREVKQRRAEHFTIGIVGYTNAGKSTLFNTLTSGGAYADNRLFATLMTRTRQWELGGGLTAMLSDTVGFVRDLPHNLIASFKATLEEATHADLLLIVLDVSDPSAELQYAEVQRTLDDLFAETARAEAADGWKPPERVLLLNKADRLKDNSSLLSWLGKVPGSIPICALPPTNSESQLGHEALVSRVRADVQGAIEHVCVTLPISDGRSVHIVDTRGEVVDRVYDGDEVTIETRIGRRILDQLRAEGAKLTVTPAISRKAAPAARKPRVARRR